MEILIFDACQRAALACTRSLGAAGYVVTTAYETHKTLAGASKYSTSQLVYPSPYKRPLEFVAWVDQTLASTDFDCILPVTEVTTDLLARHRNLWPNVHLPFADIETIDKLSNKIELFKLAQSLGVPVPQSTVVSNVFHVAREAQKIGFPCVLKPARSRVLINNQWVSTQVIVIDDEDALARVSENLPTHYFPALLQVFIPGNGAGLFALYKDGKFQARFAHQRLREKPPQGGVSVLSQSKHPDPQILEYSTKLLDAVSWQGVAMVEYRVTPDGLPYLMEINARFWGSLQLAIDAGVDFPALAVKRTFDNSQHNDSYSERVVLRWLLGDLDRLYIQFKRVKEIGFINLSVDCSKFLLTFVSSAKNEIFRINDWRPSMFELKQYFRSR